MEQSQLFLLIQKVRNGQASDEEKVIVRHELETATAKLSKEFDELKALMDEEKNSS